MWGFILKTTQKRVCRGFPFNGKVTIQWANRLCVCACAVVQVKGVHAHAGSSHGLTQRATVISGRLGQTWSRSF